MPFDTHYNRIFGVGITAVTVLLEQCYNEVNFSGRTPWQATVQEIAIQDPQLKTENWAQY